MGPPLETTMRGWLIVSLLGATVALAGPRLITGSYVGNGASAQAITTVGFKPAVLFLKGEAQMALITTSTFPAGMTKLLAGGGTSNAIITSLDSSGFTVGSSTFSNSAGVNYFFAAFDLAPGDLALGSYAGNNSDNRSIAGLGFSPAVVMIFGEGTSTPVFRTTAHVGDSTSPFYSAGSTNNIIQALEPDGFQVGTDTAVNKNSTYHYVAWRQVPAVLQVGLYAGNSTANREIDAGFLPTLVWVKGLMSLEPMVFKTASVPGNAALPAEATALRTDAITQLTPNGFVVGLDPGTNASGDSFLWVAFSNTPSGPSDAGVTDAGITDGGQPDAGTSDAGTLDAGTFDAGTFDAGTLDAGTLDAGTLDAGTFDAGTLDAGTLDAGTLDAGTETDAGASEGADAGQPAERLAIGCACNAVGPAGGAWVELVFLSLRRRKDSHARSSVQSRESRRHPSSRGGPHCSKQ